MTKSKIHLKLVLFDLDGVLYKDHNNDGVLHTIKELNLLTSEMNKHSIKTGILSINDNDSNIFNEFQKAKVDVFIKSSINKEDSLDKYVNNSIHYSEIFYIADDLLDIPVLNKVGVSACPISARREVKRIVDFVIRKESPAEIINEVKRIVLSHA